MKVWSCVAPHGDEVADEGAMWAKVSEGMAAMDAGDEGYGRSCLTLIPSISQWGAIPLPGGGRGGRTAGHDFGHDGAEWHHPHSRSGRFGTKVRPKPLFYSLHFAGPFFL